MSTSHTLMHADGAKLLYNNHSGEYFFTADLIHFRNKYDIFIGLGLSSNCFVAFPCALRIDTILNTYHFYPESIFDVVAIVIAVKKKRRWKKS